MIPIGALAWLGVRVIQQDRDLEGQRRREGLEFAAGRLALGIERRLEEIEEPLAQGRGIRLTPGGIEPAGGSALLYQPDLPPMEKVPVSVFAEAEALEHQRRDLAGAAKEYRRLAESRDPGIRAAALVGLGRALRKQPDREGALQAYARLQKMGFTAVGGQPAELIARQARCRLWEEAGNHDELRKEVLDLTHTLYAGGWRVDRATFQLYGDLLHQWGGPSPDPASIARTEAALTLWRNWRAGDLPARGRRILHEGGMPVLVLWSGGPERPSAWLATPADLEASLGPLWKAQHLAAALYDMDGQPLLGAKPAGAVALTPGETRLPFVLSAAPLTTRGAGDGHRMRGTVLISALLLAFALMLAAAYGLYRATTREMALVRQQSDFVSAVSHEFRTPLTSMRHLTDLLVSRAAIGEERKEQYYGLLAHETERLHRLVESLLSFGRMQAGAYAWRLEPADACQLVLGVVEEFRREPQFMDREILCEAEDHLPQIQADREALSRAVANLLENAGKYSEPGTPILVLARRAGGSVQISVEDRGAGIPPEEQGKLFERFVRGAEARRAGIRGIGIGLALVKSVAEAHGGSVKLASEPGRGSTFTLVIPCHES